MRLVVLQPGYLPWLGYFEQLARADVFVHYDDVQFDKHGWRNRNRIRTESPRGWSWLTVPVRTRGRLGAAVKDVEIEGTRWAEKHWRSIEQHYRKAACFAEHASALEAIYRREWRRVVDLDLALTELIARAMGIETKRAVRSSELDDVPPVASDPTARLIELCRRFGATEYFSGAAARDYLDVARFEAVGARVVFQDYAHPTYRQVYAWPSFVSHLSAIDLLLNEGPRSREVLLGGARSWVT